MKEKKNRFSYWFDNLMAGGTMALIRVLLVIMIGMLLLLALVIMLIWPEEGFGGGVWMSLTRLLDSGTFADDYGHGALYTILMVFITLLGIFITSTLTGIICNVIDEKVQSLRRGRSSVVENGHVIVLGTAGGVYTIISELIEANSNHPREALVIMDNKLPKDEMEERINARFPDKKTTQIVCRSGVHHRRHPRRAEQGGRGAGRRGLRGGSQLQGRHEPHHRPHRALRRPLPGLHRPL